MSTPARSAPLGMLAALVVITLLAFWPGLSGGFLFDDYPNIIQNERVHASEASIEQLRQAFFAYGGIIGRPLATTSFALNHAIGQLDPWGYKLVNLVVHVVNALLVMFLVGRLLRLAGTTSKVSGPAFVIALLWAIHPLQVSAVLYVVQRMETLSLTFVLLALLAYLAGRERQQDGRRAWPWLLATIPLTAAGLLSKETAVLFPAFTLALELTVLGFAANGRRTSLAWKFSYAAGVLVALGLFIAVALPHYSQPDLYAVRDFSMAERLMTQLRVLPMYLGWIVVPQPGAYVFYYDNYPVSHGLLEPIGTLFGGLLLLALAGAAIALRKRIPLFSLGVAWFFVAHLLTSNVAHLELVFEHRNYFALLGVLLAIAGLLRCLPTPEDPRVAKVGAAVLLIGALGLTLLRSATWGSTLLLAMFIAEHNPGSARASTDLGEQYMIRAANDTESEYFAMAEAEFERGSRLPNASPMPEQGLIALAAGAGIPAKQEWWDRIVHKLETRAIGPQELSMITGLMRLRHEGVEFDDARFADAYLVLANRMNMPPSQYYVFGKHALEYVGDAQLAKGLFERAVEHCTAEPEFVAVMAQDLVESGHMREAHAIADYARELGLIDVDMSEVEAAATPDEAAVEAD